MKYSIYQIVLTGEDCNEINGMENPHANHPKFKAHMLTMDEKFNEGFGYYEKVAEIDANDLEQVFHIGNMGPETAIRRLKNRMHSISVGDVVIDGNDIQWGVAGAGFTELENVIL